MNIIEVYKQFPTQDDCLDYLEEKRWGGLPTCPYCRSHNSTPARKERRFHCNNCNTSYSVTVGTIFHKTKLDFQKWFLAISLILNAKKGMSARQLARDIDVNKNTAWSMGMRIRKAMAEDPELLEGIVEVDESYIGGKGGHGSKRGRGTSKTPVVGMVERNGKIKAKAVNRVTQKRLTSLIRENVSVKDTTVITDEFSGYMRLSAFITHKSINHSKAYVDGYIHTNNIESFWSLLKRGIVGQYHKVSARHFNKYINEFCYRHRDSEDIIGDTITKALGG